MLRGSMMGLIGMVAACASTDGDATVPDLAPSAVPIPSPPPAVLEQAQSILSGFDPIESEVNWRVGDRAVYIVHLEADGEDRSWILELEVTEVSSSRPDGSGQTATYRASVHDEHGEFLESSTSELQTWYFLGSGNGFKAGELAWNTRDGPVQYSTDYGPTRLFKIILGSAALEPVIREVVDPPSLLEVVWGGGLGLCIFALPHPPRWIPVTGHEPALECYPHQLEISWTQHGAEPESKTLVQLTSWFSELKPPFHTGVGLVAMWIQHPTNPERRTWIHLVAARRGPAEVWEGA